MNVSDFDYRWAEYDGKLCIIDYVWYLYSLEQCFVRLAFPKPRTSLDDRQEYDKIELITDEELKRLKPVKVPIFYPGQYVSALGHTYIVMTAFNTYEGTISSHEAYFLSNLDKTKIYLANPFEINELKV